MGGAATLLGEGTCIGIIYITNKQTSPDVRLERFKGPCVPHPVAGAVQDSSL